MKKVTKYFLLGAGAVAAGLAAYSLFKDEKTDGAAARNEACTADTPVSPVTTSTQEFVERRKQRAAEMRAERMAEQEQALSPAVADDPADEQSQEGSMEAADMSEDKPREPVAEQCAADTAGTE
ncbi:hypothetical protein [Ruthenibacterium lactatiformans]|uniref:hypothetical protein n=1 Tax=Ruthenibacterium lactatiformans TaxID=1550024 RepID=UPI003AB7EEFD